MNSWPLVMARPQIRRILERHARRFVQTANVKRGAYVVQDSLVVRRNERLRKAGRSSEQDDPDVLAIEVSAVKLHRLGELDYQTIRHCGFHTQRDFYDEWFQRRGAIDPRQDVRVVEFEPIEEPRFLHRRVHRGYTTNPGLSALGEPEALSADELNKLGAGARARHEREHRDELCLQQARSISLRLRAAARSDRADEVLALRFELERLADRMTSPRL